MPCDGNHESIQKQIADVRVDIAALKTMMGWALIGNPIAAAVISGLVVFVSTHHS